MSQGIFGIVDLNRPIDDPEALAAKMAGFLRMESTRGAEISIEIGEYYILGMKRICGSPCQQSKIARDQGQQSLCLIHGEINNYEDLQNGNQQSHGDLDLALHLYHRHGHKFARKLNGLFSIAILDQRKRSCVLLNDRFGMAHQVYWTIHKGRFCFATHLKTLLALPGIQKEIDTEALNLFLKYSYVVSPWSMIKGINKLPPGHILIYKDKEARVNSYWDFDLPPNPITDIEVASTVYKGLLKESISKRLNTGENVGILLSGGLDSSANVALAVECTEKKLKTFSIGFENSEFDERPFARIVAEKFNTQHFEYTITGDEIEALPNLVWRMEEPYFEFGLFLTYLGLASAKKEVDIVLGGEGADQLFGTGGFVKGLPVALRYLLLKSHMLGPVRTITDFLKGDYFYKHDNLAFKLRLLFKRVTNLNDWYFYGYDEHELRSIHKKVDLASIPEIFPRNSRHIPSSFEDLYVETQINQDIKHYVNENVMVKSGRMADMLNLTLRESYLDADVADFLVSMDYSLKRKGTLFDHLKGNIKTKFLHRKAMDGILPPEIMEKPKQGGFVPVMLFLKNQATRKKIYDHLLQSEIIGEYFRRDYLNDIFINYERVQEQSIYWPNFYNSKANRILFLLTFDIWYSQYIDNYSLDNHPPALSDYLA